MIRSMTGYGEAERVLPEGRLRATVKTVNHRFLNAHLRIPPGLERLEAEIQAWLKAFFWRGHVNLALSLDRERDPGTEGMPAVDLERARQFGKLLRTLQDELDLPPGGEMEALFRFGDVLRAPEGTGAAPELEPALVREVIEEAAAMARLLREREGGRLEEDLVGRLSAMEVQVAVVEARAPARLVQERDRLRQAIADLMGQGEMDADRLAREVAYLAERWDVNEEVVRLRAHLLAFRETLRAGDGEPVGKRLGFLVQEMHREANTIASKANDLEMGRASMIIREEIERLREQLENVE